MSIAVRLRRTAGRCPHLNRECGRDGAGAIRMLDRLFGSSGAGRGLLYVFSGVVGAQIVAFIAMPILARLYSPDVFGAFSLIVALAAVVSPGAALRTESAVLLPSRNNDVAALVWVGVLSIVVVSLLYGSGLQVWIHFNPAASAAQVPGAAVFVAAMVALTSLYALTSQLALRERQYGLVGTRPLVQALTGNIAQMALSFASRDVISLATGELLGRSAGIIVVVSQTRHFFARSSWTRMRGILRRYWKFPVVFAPSAVLNALGSQVPLLFVSLAYGLGAAGQLGMAERIVAIPLALIGASVAQVVDAEISKNMRDKNPRFYRTFTLLSLALGGLAALVMVSAWVLGPVVVPWFLGEQWVTAGVFIQILGVATAVRLVSSPLSRLILLFERAGANLVLDLTRVALLALSIWISLAAGLDMYESLWLVYGSIAVTHIAIWVYVFSLVRREYLRMKGGSE